MSTEREKTPREGTARYKFVRVIEGGVGVHETRKISEITGWTRRKVAQTRSDVQAAGILERTTPELTTLIRHTQAATILLLIQDYRIMGLSIPETQLAVHMEKEIELPYESVKGSIVNATRKGYLRKLNREEQHDIKIDAHRLTPEEKKENVAALLKLRNKFLRDKQPLPTNRLEWKKAIMQNSGNVTFSPRQHRESKKVSDHTVEKGSTIYELAKPVFDAGLTPNRPADIPAPEIRAEEKLYILRNLPLPIPTDLNKNDISFLNALISNGLIDQDNPVFFETLEDLFAKSNRQEDFDRLLPEIKLRLEAFARAIMQEVQENRTDSRTRFAELGLQFGKEWFYDQTSVAVKEQKFIADKIRQQHRAPVTSQAVNATRTIPPTKLDLYRHDDPEE